MTKVQSKNGELEINRDFGENVVDFVGFWSPTGKQGRTHRG
jgi:hypothetical protein